MMKPRMVKLSCLPCLFRLDLQHGYINFGATTHLSHECNEIKNYEKISPIKIYMGGNSILEVIKKKNIQVLMSMGGNEGVEVLFTNVLHILGIIIFYL